MHGEWQAAGETWRTGAAVRVLRMACFGALTWDGRWCMGKAGGVLGKGETAGRSKWEEGVRVLEARLLARSCEATCWVVVCWLLGDHAGLGLG